MGLVLLVLALFSILAVGLSVLQYVQSSEYGGIATQVPPLEYFPRAPEVLIPAALGITAALGAVGVLRGHRWGRILAVGLGAAINLGGLFALANLVREWGMPGSFAVLSVPPAIVAFLVGGFVVYVALRNAAYLSR